MPKFLKNLSTYFLATALLNDVHYILNVQPLLFLLLLGEFSKALQYLNNNAIIYNVDFTWNNCR